MRRAAHAAVLAVLLAVAVPARAHEGPPYPIAMDEPLGPYEVSVWADPDVGTGTLWVVLTQPDPRAGDASVRVAVRPRDPPHGQAVDWTSWGTHVEPSGEGEMHVAEIAFEREEWVDVRVVVDGPQGGGTLERTVEVTPPGQGPWLDFALYLFPFVAVGCLLLKAALRRRKLMAAAAEPRRAVGREQGPGAPG